MPPFVKLISGGQLDPRGNPTISNGRLYGQDFESLRQECLDQGQLWTDPEFPPDNQSLYFSDKIPFNFEWKRASELVDDPQLFVGGASRFDINQVRKLLRDHSKIKEHNFGNIQNPSRPSLVCNASIHVTELMFCEQDH